MGLVDDLTQARADYEQGDWTAALDVWSDIEPDDLSAEDLHDAALAAYLLGHRDASVDFHQRGYARYQQAGSAAGAMRCCFHLAMIFGSGGEHALERGWTTRAERLLDELTDEAVEHGYVTLLHMYRHLGSNNLPAATEAAAAVAAVARRSQDPDLLAFGLSSQGRLAIYAGAIADGLTLLDEAMTGAAAHELTPVVFGHVYCAAIEGCQEIADFGRVAEWTSALHRWCLAQPGLVAFTGQCSLHRGQLMRVHGAWPEALEEFARAIERYRRADSVAAVGLAECERGDVLRQRGEFDAAERAYERSSEHGYDPQPGLALLWFARGANEAAVAAVRRLVAEASDPVAQCRLLPAAVDVLVAAGALDEARVVAAQLEVVAVHVGTDRLQALRRLRVRHGGTRFWGRRRSAPVPAQGPPTLDVRAMPLRRCASAPDDRSRPDGGRRRRVGPQGAGGRVRRLPRAGRHASGRGGRAPAAAGRPSGRADGARGRGVAPGRVG